MELEVQNMLKQKVFSVLSDPSTVAEFTKYGQYSQNPFRTEVISTWLADNLTDEQRRIFKEIGFTTDEDITDFIQSKGGVDIVLAEPDLEDDADDVYNQLFDKVEEQADKDSVEQYIDYFVSPDRIVSYAVDNHTFRENDFIVDPSANIDTLIDLASDNYYDETTALTIIAGHAQQKYTGANFGDWLSDYVSNGTEVELAVNSLMHNLETRDIDELSVYRKELNDIIAEK